ncbi:hypothetical protein AVEN_25337-1 [Araneus ventricosus]|uniref:Reverse transcriptase domain-containing protein n=1 Tax=Araneus ventricosus TaxID=182803 RepID=A0A4Y2EEY3_ARAVE|nr:hypothetical protein AVEN_25337-1 [Araneus ventricosus]
MGKPITGNCKQLKSVLTAIETNLGRTVIGGATNSGSIALLTTSMFTKTARISDLWTLGSLGITDTAEKKILLELKDAAKGHFLETVSPFLLRITIRYHIAGVLEHHADDSPIYPKNIIQKFMNSFYVDNFITSVSNRKELELFIEVARNVKAERKFDLRGWEHTYPNTTETAETKVLGMIWNKRSVTLRVNTSVLKEICVEKITKRTAPSAAYKLVYPIGVACPVSLVPKLLLQKIWKIQIIWDREVDETTRDDFLKWLIILLTLRTCSSPDFLVLKMLNTGQYIFSAMLANAAAFLRIITTNSVKVYFLQARSRVAPTRKGEITIARFELLSATILYRLSKSILSEVECEEVWFCTDSSSVLTWITKEEPWGGFRI